MQTRPPSIETEPIARPDREWPRADAANGDDRRSFARNLAFYGIAPQQAELVVPAGRTSTLDTTPGATGVVVPRLLATRDLDRFKAWLGVPDHAFERGDLPPYPVSPLSPWLGDDLAEPDPAAVLLARQAYVHGYSKLIEGGKALIERLSGEFRASCAAIGRRVVEPGAALVVQGTLPAVLIVGELRLYEPGTLRIQTETRMCVDRLVKIEADGRAR